MTLHFGDAFVNLMPQLLSSLLVVLQITLFGFSLALVVGFAIALGRLSKSKVLRGFLVVIVEFFRGTPLLVQCFYIYFVFPVLFKMVGLDNIRITAVTAGIIGFGLNYGCYMSEVIRSAILSVDHGQMEAGLALGYKKPGNGKVYHSTGSAKLYSGIWKLSDHNGKRYLHFGIYFRGRDASCNKKLCRQNLSDCRILYDPCTDVSGDQPAIVKTCKLTGKKAWQE